MKSFGQKPRVQSRCNNKENKQLQETALSVKPAHFQIHMAAVKNNTTNIRENKLSSPTNQHQNHTASNSLEKPLKESLNFSVAGRQSVAQVLSKSTSKLVAMRPRIDFQPSTTKHRQSHSKSFLRSKEAFQPNRLAVKGALSRALFEVSKYSYEGLHAGLDNCLQEVQQEVEPCDREAIGLVRILLQKVFQKHTQHYREKIDALEEAEELAKLYKQELKRKGRELLWLKQQMSCTNEPQWKFPKSPQPQSPSHLNNEEHQQYLSETDQSSICSYIVPPAQPQQPMGKLINDELRNKLRLNIRKVKDLRQLDHQNPSD